MNTTFKKITKILIPRIVAIILLIGTGLGECHDCITMIDTAWKLHSISSNIAYIEELANTTPSGWNSEREEEYNELIEKRNSLINSSNLIASKFAQSNNLQRTGLLILHLFVAVLLLYSGVRFIPSTIRYIKRIFEE